MWRVVSARDALCRPRVVVEEAVKHHVELSRMGQVIAMQGGADIFADHLLHLLRPVVDVHQPIGKRSRVQGRQGLVFTDRGSGR